MVLATPHLPMKRKKMRKMNMTMTMNLSLMVIMFISLFVCYSTFLRTVVIRCEYSSSGMSWVSSVLAQV